LRVGFATRETMSGGPPSADITYSLPEAHSAISFAVPLDKDKIRAFLRKDLPNGRVEHEIDNIKAYLKIYRLSREVEKYLIGKDYKAHSLFPNFKYREDIPMWRVRSMPPVSLRYLAVRSGVGSYGWSGNVGIKGIGAPIILGGVLTDAKLQPTDPIPPEESFCDECKLCTKVCAMRMFSDKTEESVELGGKAFNFSTRINLYRCFIGCGGFSGLDKTGKWSTWSPGRYPYPETDDEVVDVLSKSFKFKRKWYIKGEYPGYDVSKLQEDIGFTDEEAKKMLAENKGTFKDIKNTTLTCGNCQLICWGDPKETAENYKILTNSGCVIQKKNRELIVLPTDEAKEMFDAMGGKHKRGIGGRIKYWVAKKYLTRAYKYFVRD